jgi:hypothetical protein
MVILNSIWYDTYGFQMSILSKELVHNRYT